MKNHPNKYPYNRDNYSEHNSSKPDALALFVNEALQEIIVVSALGVSFFIKTFVIRFFYIAIPLLLGLGYFSWWATGKALHIKFIHNLAPDIFTYDRLIWMYNYHHVYHSILFFCLIMVPILLILGIYSRSIRTKYQKIFSVIGLKNGQHDTPKLIKTKGIDKYRQQFTFDANGLSIDDFRSKQDRLGSYLKKNVDMIRHGKNKGQIVVIINEKDFTESISYQELSEQVPLPGDCFFVGKSIEEILIQSIVLLPHLLIAGETGSGKSIFFKQVILGLLESTSHIQIYAIDLKGGLEMTDFAKAPNVKVIKTMSDAVKLLRQIVLVMKDRFKYMEKNGLKQIIPVQHQMERIVIAVDEASVLFMRREKNDKEYNLSVEARRLIDTIAKLSRAAAIHLVLATQKLEKNVVPTSVSENISGRMAFKANSLQGSLIVMGTKDAMDLPDIPGRGIWNLGAKKMLVQAPYVDEKLIKYVCSNIADEYTAGSRTMFHPMIGAVEEAKAKQGNSPVFDYTKGTKNKTNQAKEKDNKGNGNESND